MELGNHKTGNGKLQFFKWFFEYIGNISEITSSGIDIEVRGVLKRKLIWFWETNRLMGFGSVAVWSVRGIFSCLGSKLLLFLGKSCPELSTILGNFSQGQLGHYDLKRSKLPGHTVQQHIVSKWGLVFTLTELPK